MHVSVLAPSKVGKTYIYEPELWKETEALVRDVLIRTNTPFIEVPDEAAFYGPKIDVQIWSTIGREFTLATNQVDFSQGKSFKLEFTNKDNHAETPLIIHRAPLQVKILPITDKSLEYAQSLLVSLKNADIRVEVDDRSEKIGKKIRDTELAKVPYMLVVGEKEMAENKVAVRRQGKGDLGVRDIEEFIAEIKKEIIERAPNP